MFSFLAAAAAIGNMSSAPALAVMSAAMTSVRIMMTASTASSPPPACTMASVMAEPMMPATPVFCSAVAKPNAAAIVMSKCHSMARYTRWRVVTPNASRMPNAHSVNKTKSSEYGAWLKAAANATMATQMNKAK